MNPILKRILTIVGALALLVYVGYQASQMLFSSVKTETVYSHSVYKTVESEGLVIRRETPVAGRVDDGYVYYSVSNGERVAKDGKIADVYNNEADALATQQLLQLDEQIAALETIDAQGIANRVNLDVINQQVSSKINSLSAAMHASRVEGLTDTHTQLLELLNKQQITTGKVESFADRLAALRDERSKLASSHKGAKNAIASPVAGYFVSQVDGYESLLSYDDVTKLQVGDIQNHLTNKPTVNANEYLGKVVGDYEWYLACVVSEADAVRMQIGTELTVLLPFATDETIEVEVVAANADKNGSVAVIFKSSQMSEALSSLRHESVQIQIEQYTGLRIPKSALVFNDKNETGVFVRSGNTAAFRKVEIIYSGADYSICAETQDGTGLKLYDDIIVEGKGLYDGKIIQ